MSSFNITVRDVQGTFRSAEEVTSFLATIPENERYEVEVEVLQKMMKFHERASDMIEKVFVFIRDGGAFRSHITDREFQSTWAEACQIVENNQKRRNRMLEAKTAILKRWPGKDVASWLDNTTFSTNFLHSCRRLAGAMKLDTAAKAVNAAAVGRLSGGKKWAKDIKGLTSGDFDLAYTNRHVAVTKVTPKEVRDLGMDFGICGFVEEAVVVVEGDSELVPAGCMLEREVRILPHLKGRNRDASSEESKDKNFLYKRKRARISTDHAAEFGIPMGEGAELDEKGLDEAEDELLEEEKRAREDERSAGLKSCRCSPDVPLRWKIAINSRKSLGMAADMRLLAKMQTFTKVCFPHERLMASHLGLCTHRLDVELLHYRLQYVLEHRLEIGNLKTDNDTYQWFRIASRPARPSDGLGPYKYAHLTQSFSFDQKKILSAMDETIEPTWRSEGSVIVPLFRWWFEHPILRQQLLDEFDMYHWHLREINGRKNIGWLRNMFHSVGQQLMRQDPAYYMLYAALRPDQAWRLVSFPYYAKYSSPGDGTYFCHIDLNIPNLLANQRGVHMIQGTVSMDEEDKENCTFILPGMQHKLGQWWERVVERGQETSGYVHRITDQSFTREDSKVLSLDWKLVPCHPGDVRVTLPSIPHGATGPTTKLRRTMLPWFVAVQDDEETLEVVEGGSWTLLAEAHRDQTAPSTTPSGLPNRYGATPYRFPASMELCGLGAVSDALVCRRRWNSPAVLRERDILLGADRNLAHEFINEWRKKAILIAIDTLAKTRLEEKQVFQDKSFYHHQDRLREEGIPIPDVEPDIDQLSNEVLEEAEKEGLLFAEDGGNI